MARSVAARQNAACYIRASADLRGGRFNDAHGTVRTFACEAVRSTDAGIILWRKILARELRAIAEGRWAKTWKTPPADVVPTLGF
jgi:hypothetical protein